MARFVRHIIPGDTPGQTVWKKIRDLLVTNHSVEVLVTNADENSEDFELRAWTDVRDDESNHPDADDSVPY